MYTVGTKDSNPSHHWIGKNHDYTPEGLLKILLSSELQFIQQMSGMTPQQISSSSTPSLETTSSSHSMSKRNLLITSEKKKLTVADRFVSSMNELFVSLRSSSCSFIKCIKPNRHLKPFTFDDSYVIEQVRSLGLVQVCEVMKVGLPIRLPFHEILEKYRDIYFETQQFLSSETAATATAAAASTSPTTGDQEEIIFITGLLYALKIPIESYKLGKSILFFIPNSFELVDLILTSATATAQSQRGQEIRNGIIEGIKIRKLSSELIGNLNVRLLGLDDRIGEMKLEIDQFDGTIGALTSDMERLDDEIHRTKFSIDAIADLLPLEQLLLKDIESEMNSLLSSLASALLGSQNETQNCQNIFLE